MSWASNAGSLAALAVLSIAVGTARPAMAETEESDPDQDRARALAHEALDLMEAERWGDAHERLEQAYSLFRAPTLAVLSARALERVGKLVAARNRYREAATMTVDEEAPRPFRRAVKEGRREAARLDEEIPRLTIVVEGTGENARVEVDGGEVRREEWGHERELDPGPHVITAKREGRIVSHQELRLEAGDRTRLVLSWAGPAAPAEPVLQPPRSGSSSTPLVGWLGLGVGAAGLTTGIVAGYVMLDARAELDDNCRDLCPPDQRATLSRFRTARGVSLVGYSVGLVGLGLGGFALWSGGDGSTTQVAIQPGGAEVKLRGHF